MLKKFLCVFATTLLLSACATTAPADRDEASAADPWEGFNRGMFKFNEVLDGVLLKPIALVYHNVIPEPGREGVHNFLTNLTSPVGILNSTLQGNADNAFRTFWRFMFNSTLGIGGIFDFAGAIGLEANQEDFGQTMGVWGVGSGPYLVLPVIGPTSGRDIVGKVVDIFSDPFTYYLERDDVYKRAIATVVDTRERNLDLIDDIYEDSIDPYAKIRSLYLQKREGLIKNRSAVGTDTLE